MTFDHPWLLVVGIALAALLARLYVWSEQKITRRDLVYSNVAFFTEAVQPRAWIPAVVRGAFFGSLVLAALALGGLHLRLPVPVHDGAVFICIDTSGSMASTDVTPTRASAAKAAAAAFIDATPGGTRIGIIAFSGNAVLVSPLSADRERVKASLDAIPPPNGATAIGDALQLADQSLPAKGHRVVVLITDGVNNTGVDPQQAAQALGSRHVPVYTIGIGTPNGDIIGGEQSTIDEGALQDYAASSGGAYARAEDAAQLRSALARLGRETSLEVQQVAAALPLALIAVLGVSGALLSGLVTGRIP